MEPLFDTVALALRLGASAKEALRDEIDRNIRTAKADMIRVGVSPDVVEEEGELVTEAVVTYCLYKMGAPDRMDKYWEAYQYQIDGIRKAGKMNGSQE